MIAPLLVFVASSLQGDVPFQGPIHPRVFTSPSGRWALDVNPSTDSEGAATYRLFLAGAVVWEREHPFTLTEVFLTEEALAFGHGYWDHHAGGCGLYAQYWNESHVYPVAVVHPNGEAEVLDELLHVDRPAPGAPTDGRLVLARCGAGGGRPVLRTYARPDSTDPPTFPGPDSSPHRELGDILAARRPFRAPVPRTIELQWLGNATLHPARLATVDVDAAGRVLVADRGAMTIDVFDGSGRHLEHHEPLPAWGAPPVLSVTSDHDGRILASTRDGVWRVGEAEPLLAGERTVLAARGLTRRWEQVLLNTWRSIPAGTEGEEVVEITRAPTGHWLVRSSSGALGPAGELLVLDERLEGGNVLFLLHKYEADGRPVRSLELPHRAVRVATDGVDALTLERTAERNVLWIHGLDGVRSLRAEVESSGYPFFSPAGDEIWIVGFTRDPSTVVLRRFARPAE